MDQSDEEDLRKYFDNIVREEAADQPANSSEEGADVWLNIADALDNWTGENN